MPVTIDIATLKSDYNWTSAFSYAQDFSIADVAIVIDSRDGANEGPNWIIYGQLKDGCFFFLSAGCDYTGWDCQASGTSSTHANLQDLIRLCMGDDERDRFGLKA